MGGLKSDLVQWNVVEKGGCPVVSVPSASLAENCGPGVLPFSGYGLPDDLCSAAAVDVVEGIKSACADSGLARFTLLGHGSGAGIVQLAAHQLSKQVRRIVVINGTTRPASTALERMVDRLERFFPLGLPLRRRQTELDTRVFLHRIHCPALVLISPDANQRVKAESEYLASKLPNSWLVKLEQECSDGDKLVITDELAQLLTAFDKVPTKRPQKNKKV